MVLLECLMVVIMEWLLVVIMGCLVVNLIKKILNDEVSDYLIHNISGDDYHLRLLCNTLINKALKPLCKMIPKEPGMMNGGDSGMMNGGGYGMMNGGGNGMMG